MRRVFRILAPTLIVAAAAASGCSSADGKTTDHPEARTTAVAVAPTAAIERPIARYIRATGTLTAEEQAAVAAEIAGRVEATPVERGTAVSAGSELVRLSAAEADAQLKEAEANAAQIEARLGLAPGATFDASQVPEVQNAKAAFALAESEFSRIQSLLEQRVVSQSEYDQRWTQVEAARQQYEAAKNSAAQQFQSLQAARARVALARKALGDTSVRSPFAGLVAERTVSIGDYVTKGTKVATVVRVNPLRGQITIPEQFVSAVAPGQLVELEVDAYPGRSFEGRVRYVSPALETNRRALIVEAVVSNPRNELKPGLFATARLEQATRTPAVLVPATAVQTTAGTSRVYVVNGDHVDERIVTVGDKVDSFVEITKGLKTGEPVATKNVASLADGAKVRS